MNYSGIMGRSFILLSLLLLAACTGEQKAPPAAATTSGSEGEMESDEDRLTLAPCTYRDVEGTVLCGTFDVYENRQTQQGRKLQLKVVVLKALGANPAPDPFVSLAGGPGVSIVAYFEPARFAAIRQTRDILLVDQRGTGQSNPLHCPPTDEDPETARSRSDFDVEVVQMCREHLEPHADLTQYTTPIAMDDLDDLRAALGYEKLNLEGGSYGSRAALVYLRRHPHHVRAVILKSAIPTYAKVPLPYAKDAQHALELIAAKCGADTTCQATYPDLRPKLHAVMERLRQGAVPVTYTEPDADQPIHMEVSYDLFVSRVRFAMYYNAFIRLLPQIIQGAYAGNFVPFARFHRSLGGSAVGTLSLGLNLSVTCAEDVAFIAPEEVEEETRGTFLGDTRVRRQMAACAIWPRARISEDYHTPVRGKAPVLIISGELDPVTPPRWGDEIARHLPNSLHKVIPNWAHGYAPLGCEDEVMADFVERGTLEGLDTSCLDTLASPLFEGAPTR